VTKKEKKGRKVPSNFADISIEALWKSSFLAKADGSEDPLKVAFGVVVRPHDGVRISEFYDA